MPRGRSRQPDGYEGVTADLFRDAIPEDPLSFERQARSDGYARIAGLDEAGRGPLAGPVVAAAVMLPEGLLLPGADRLQAGPRAGARTPVRPDPGAGCGIRHRRR